MSMPKRHIEISTYLICTAHFTTTSRACVEVICELYVNAKNKIWSHSALHGRVQRPGGVGSRVVEAQEWRCECRRQVWFFRTALLAAISRDHLELIWESLLSAMVTQTSLGLSYIMVYILSLLERNCHARSGRVPICWIVCAFVFIPLSLTFRHHGLHTKLKPANIFQLFQVLWTSMHPILTTIWRHLVQSHPSQKRRGQIWCRVADRQSVSQKRHKHCKYRP